MPGRPTNRSAPTDEPASERPAVPLTACGPGNTRAGLHAKGHCPEHPTFAELGVLPATVEALEAVGITHPFPIQALTLPVALHGHDIIGQAKTGTGKTLGFGIPLLQRVVATTRAARTPPLPVVPRQAAGARRRADPRAVRPGHRAT